MPFKKPEQAEGGLEMKWLEDSVLWWHINQRIKGTEGKFEGDEKKEGEGAGRWEGVGIW